MVSLEVFSDLRMRRDKIPGNWEQVHFLEVIRVFLPMIGEEELCIVVVKEKTSSS